MLMPLMLLVAQMGSFDPRRDYAAGVKEAYLMMPPETVCGGNVEEMVWTGDGKYLVVRRQVQNITAADLAAFGMGVQPSPEDQARMRPHIQVVVWSLKSRKLQTVLDVPNDGKTTIGELEVMPGSDRVFVSTGETIVDVKSASRTLASFSMLSASTGTLTPMDRFDPEGKVDLMLSLSPVAPVGLIEAVDHSKPIWTVRFFGPSGTPGASVEVPARSYAGFNDSGVAGYSFVVVEKGKRIARFQTLDPATGRLGAILAAKDAPGKPKTETLTTTETAGFAPTILLNVTGGKAEESGVVTTDGVKPIVSPKLDAVAYVGQGSAMVRTLARVPREAFDKARAAAERTVALSKAKQVGLGLMMYSSDMDDKLPGQGENIRSLLGPYLQNDKLMDGFNYTFGGGSMTGIDDPASTEMGFVSGPGGRAVVYADGHAKWIPDGH